MNRPKHKKSADYLSLVELKQISDFDLAGSEASFIQKIHSIRNKCLRDFVADEIRVCLAQDIGTSYLLPKALDILEANPWIEAEHYEGDLLKVCIDVEGECWNILKTARSQMRKILETANELIKEGRFTGGRQEIRDLKRGFERFGTGTEQAAS